MNKILLIFVAQYCLIFVGCYSVSNVNEVSDSNIVKQNQSVADITATPKPTVKTAQTVNPTPTPDWVAKVDLVRTGLYHNDHPRLGEHYKPAWIEDEQSDNGYEPFCVQSKMNGKKIEKCGYQDEKGKVLIKPIFNTVFVFSEGLAGVCPKNSQLCGYINEKGELVIKANYQFVDVFSEGLAVICIGDTDYYKYGYLDKEGEYVIRPQYSDANAFKNGIAEVTVQRSLNKCINKKNENVECSK